jgi:DNA replication protein DnaC
MTEAVSCTICNDQGFLRTETKSIRKCICIQEREVRWRVARSGIPVGYEGASFERFQAQSFTQRALLMARRFTESYLPTNALGSEPRGILFTGSVGTGKTHLAVSILRAVIIERGADGIFVDTRDMLARLRASYGQDATESEFSILQPLFKADIVVLDELGAVRPSDWAFEMTELVIGKLYSANKAAIVTSNFPNAAPGGTSSQTGYERAARQETLGDRIGARMWSRLQQMCVPVEMIGPDFRVGGRK